MNPISHRTANPPALNRAGHAGWPGRLPTVFLCAALLCLTARAQITWINPAGGDWNVATNWDFGAVPGIGDSVNLTSSLGAAYAVGYGAPMAASSVYSVAMNGATAAEAVTLEIAAAGFNVDDRISIGTNSTVAVQPGAMITVGILEGRKGTLILNGGSVTSLTAFTHGTGGKPGAPFNMRIYGGAFSTPATTLGSSENGGTLIVAGGEVDLGVYSAGRDSGSTANGFSTGLIVSNGTVRLSGITLSTGNSAASMRVSGGHVTNTGPLIIGSSSTATARETGYRQTGGVFDTTAAWQNIVLGNTAEGQRVSLDVRGGLFYAYGVTLVNDPAFTGVNATFSVTDTGVAYLGEGGVVNNATTYTVGIGNGGRLTAFAPYTIGGDLTLSGGVGILEAATADHTPVDLVITGGLKGAGTLAKTGAGKAAIQGTGTHTGEIQVREGVLALEGAGSIPATASIVVWEGARFNAGAAFALNGGQALAGVGTVAGNVTAVSGAGLRPAGNGGTGTLALEGSLTLEGGVTATFDIQSAAAKDLLVVNGALILNSTNTILITSTLGSGTYRLIDYGTLVGDVASLQVVGVSGYVTNNAAAGAIDLVLESVGRDPASLVWAGDGVSNLWDIGVTANWLNEGAKDWFFPNDAVLFNNAGSATPAVELVGDLTPSMILVDAAKDYTFGGSGRIVGATGLIKTNSGVLALNTINDFTGISRIGGGTVRVPVLANGGVPSPLGSAVSDPSNLALIGGALDYTGPTVSTDRGVTLEAGVGTLVVSDPAATLTWAGRITGAGALTKSGPGVLQLGNADNDYGGGTVVAGGTLLFGNAGAGAITLHGGTFATTADQQNLPNPLVALGTDNHYRNSKNNTLAAISGDGSLDLDFAAATDTITIEGDMSGFTGRITARGSGGNWRFYRFATPGSPAAAFDLGTNGATMLTRNGNTTVRLGSLAGDATTKLTGASSVTGALTTYEIGGNHASTTFDGLIEDNARPAPVAIRKIGAGTLTLTAASTYTGPTRIEEGTLALTGFASIGSSSLFEVAASAALDLTGLADPTLYLMNAGQTIAGAGTIRGNINAGAGTAVTPGSPVGTLTVTGSIVLDGTTVMELDRALTPNSDRIVASGITANYVGALVVTNVGGRLSAGDQFQLFSRAVSGGLAAIELPSTDASGATYTWENNLATDGSIRVVTASGGIPDTPTRLTVATTAPGTLTVSWPADYIGWSLESQTNSLSAGLGTNWTRVAGSNMTNVFEIPVNTDHGAVFFRMALP